MKVFRLTALSLALLTLASCSSIGLESKRVDYQAAAIKVPQLEVPPDLTTPAAEDHFTIPDGGIATASYSDYAKGNVSQAQGTSILPEFKTVHVERNGGQRWLVINDKAENVWPIIKAFWQENGFAIKIENPKTGIIETDWAENRAKIPADGIRKVLGKVMDMMYDSGERDMYHMRLERSKDGSSTEIYLTQYGKEEVLSADKTSSQWQSRPNDPELEATMLQMLMVKLGGAEMQGKLQAEMATPKGLSSHAQLLTRSNGSKTILLSEPFDRSWRTVGLALEHNGLVIEDKDRASGIYFLRIEETSKEEKKSFLDRIAFWNKKDTVKSAKYQVTVHDNKTGCEIASSNAKGESNADSQKIIDDLYKAFRK